MQTWCPELACLAPAPSSGSATAPTGTTPRQVTLQYERLRPYVLLLPSNGDCVPRVHHPYVWGKHGLPFWPSFAKPDLMDRITRRSYPERLHRDQLSRLDNQTTQSAFLFFFFLPSLWHSCPTTAHGGLKDTHRHWAHTAPSIISAVVNKRTDHRILYRHEAVLARQTAACSWVGSGMSWLRIVLWPWEHVTSVTGFNLCAGYSLCSL